jgi:hypothetical protein
MLNVQSLLDKRRDGIIDFFQHIHEFTSKDLELEKNADDSEQDIVDGIIKRCMIDHITTKAQMLQEYQIYLIKKGHSIPYMLYTVQCFVEYIKSIENE